MKKGIFFSLIAFILLFSSFAVAQQSEITKELKKLNAYNEHLEHRLNRIQKMVDDIIWFQRIGDVAFIDKVYIAGPPKWKEENPTAQGAGNPVKFWTYVFIPKDINFNKKYPLIVFPHGGVHSNFTTYYTHIIRELMYQKYVVVASEYRGSTGYGEEHYKKIDYGGREIEDVDAGRRYVINNYSFVDSNRVGIIGWSHGGLITLMDIFKHPKHYKVAYAGVPVSDLIARMGYKDQSYRNLYEAPYHIGQSACDNVEEYRRRSPAWNAEKLQTPLLIHTNTNDADVNVLEVEHLIQALKAAGKKFQYKIFKNVPGGHSFNRMDRKQARVIRVGIYKFLAKYLNPPKPIRTLKQINTAAYLFGRK